MTRLLGSVLLWVFAATALADDGVEVLRAELQTLRDRVVELEQQLAELSAPEQHAQLIEQAIHPLPATVTAEQVVQGGRRLAIGGRIKVDALGSSRSAGGPGGSARADTAFLPAAVPLDAVGESRQFSASARDSRLWLDAVLPTAVGDLEAYLETDFVSSDGSGNERVSNSFNLRLRHAYARLGGFTVGQTYSTLLHVSAYPELNDAHGPVGILNIRQPLLRYRRATGFGSWALALEQPETVLRDATGTRVAVDDDRLPDIIGRVDVEQRPGSWSLALILRQLRADGVVAGASDSAWGYGASVSGRLYLGERDNLRFALTAGEGLGRYVSFNAFAAGRIDADGGIRLEPLASGFVAWQRRWNERWRSTWAVGAAAVDLDASLAADESTEALYSSHLNLLWSPVPEATLGIEWLHGRREVVDGRVGVLNRVQFTSLYRFRQ